MLTAKHYDLDAAIEAIRPAVGPRHGGAAAAQRARPSRPARGGVRRRQCARRRRLCRREPAAATAASTTTTGCRASPSASAAAAISDRAQGDRGRVRRHQGRRAGQRQHHARYVGKVRDDHDDGRDELPDARQYRRDHGDRGRRGADARSSSPRCTAVAAAAGFAPRAGLSRPDRHDADRARAASTTPRCTTTSRSGSPHRGRLDHRRHARAARAEFDLQTPLLRAAYCHLQVHENRVAAAR